MTAIKAGILTQTTKAELEKAEAEKRGLNGRWPMPPTQVRWCPSCHALRRFTGGSLTDLGAALQKDVARARGHIKALLGDEVRLMPEEGNLVAEIGAITLVYSA